MRVVIGTETRTAVSAAVEDRVRQLGHEVRRVDDGLGWADVGLAVARAVTDDIADRGVAFCGNGVGVTIAANKAPQIRAALCHDPETAVAARRYLDANVVTLGLDVITPEAAARVVEAFLRSPADAAEVDQIAASSQRFEPLGREGG